MDHGQDEDVTKIRAENEKLRKTIKQLTVDKNMMEYRLLRAFRKLLNTKKRKIKRLERSLKKLRGEDCVQNEDDPHCDTCRCGRNGRNRNQQVAVAAAEDNDDSDGTMDPGSCYGSETDIDEDDKIPSNNVNPPAAVDKKSSLVSTESTVSSQRGPQEEGTSKVFDKKEDKNNAIARDKTDNIAPNCEGTTNKSNKSESDCDMDDLVDDFCS